MIDNSKVINIVNFVKKKFPEADAALLTGSFATKEEKNKSDIDLIIFSQSISKSFVEKINIDSLKYDIIYLSTHYNYLLNELYLDIQTRYGVYSNMISTGRILFDKNDLLKDLIYFTKNILIKEYGKIDLVEIEFRRKLISNALEDIEDTDSIGEFYFASSLIVEEITNLILSTNESTIGRGKNKARELKSIDSEFYYDLTNSIIKIDKKEFKKVVQNKLDLYGGVLDSYSPKNTPSIISDTNIKYEILLNKKYFCGGLICSNYNKLIDFFEKISVNLLFFYVQNDKFIIVVESLKFNNRLSRNIINWLSANYKIESNDRIIIKLSKSKLIPFVCSEINTFLEQDLIFFTNFILKKKQFKNNLDTLIFSYHLVNKVINNNFIFDKKIVYDYLYHSNILNVADTESFNLNYFQLIDYRKKNIGEINVLSESLSLHCIEERLTEDYYSSLIFPKIITDIGNNDLNVFKKSIISNNQIDSSKLLILNFYLKPGLLCQGLIPNQSYNQDV